ncbi:MAG TPA: hypothetical protein ENI23_10850 [bacterium]|nr:hypothetical protein [bacterium]
MKSTLRNDDSMGFSEKEALFNFLGFGAVMMFGCWGAFEDNFDECTEKKTSTVKQPVSREAHIYLSKGLKNYDL